MAGIATWRSPVFVSQGDDDRNVPFDQGVELVNALQARGIAVTTSAVPNELHEFTTYANESSRFAQSAEFLERALGAR
jgi:dipeptidyl aminopeptidase/acylaminoacyl peptidase